MAHIVIPGEMARSHLHCDISIFSMALNGILNLAQRPILLFSLYESTFIGIFSFHCVLMVFTT